MKLLLLAIVVSLGACAQIIKPAPASPPLADESFAPADPSVSAADVFALSPSMQEFVRQHFDRKASPGTLHEVLVDALYSENQLKLTYDHRNTRAAAETFEHRRGNCLSLVIMTAAFAKALNLQIQYHLVLNSNQWHYDGPLLLRTGHVNLSLSPANAPTPGVTPTRHSLTVDFLPGEDLAALKTELIDERRLTALYLNNRAAELLTAGDTRRAYWWARAAALYDPGAVSALNTLGTIYLRTGHTGLARSTFALALEQAPNYTLALSNLILVLQAQGDETLASQMRRRLAQLEWYPPLHWQAQGVQALHSDNPASALILFERELARNGPSAELMGLMAQAQYRLGQVAQAKESLALAADLTARGSEQQRYLAKLAWLRAQ